MAVSVAISLKNCIPILIFLSLDKNPACRVILNHDLIKAIVFYIKRLNVVYPVRSLDAVTGDCTAIDKLNNEKWADEYGLSSEHFKAGCSGKLLLPAKTCIIPMFSKFLIKF